MRVVIQKSGYAKVEIDDNIVAEIDRGLVILLGITNNDSKEDINYLVEKITNIRLFEEEEKHFEKSIVETSKNILLISQFTLYSSVKKGRRPDFAEAAKAEIAKPLYKIFIKQLEKQELNVQTGKFGAMMKVSLTNEGPITIIIDSKNR